eukprot:8862704-Karenia_brevis.AAC.1
MGSLSSSPAHIALDNASVVKKGSNIRTWVNTHGTCPYNGQPYALQNNGDLWQIFHDILLARGPHSIRISKTKGHAAENATFLAENPHL